jgi:hypothetical protein
MSYRRSPMVNGLLWRSSRPWTTTSSYRMGTPSPSGQKPNKGSKAVAPTESTKWVTNQKEWGTPGLLQLCTWMWGSQNIFSKKYEVDYGRNVECSATNELWSFSSTQPVNILCKIDKEHATVKLLTPLSITAHIKDSRIWKVFLHYQYKKNALPVLVLHD